MPKGIYHVNEEIKVFDPVFSNELLTQSVFPDPVDIIMLLLAQQTVVCINVRELRMPRWHLNVSEAKN